jgi:hypothetical protein
MPGWEAHVAAVTEQLVEDLHPALVGHDDADVQPEALLEDSSRTVRRSGSSLTRAWSGERPSP